MEKHAEPNFSTAFFVIGFAISAMLMLAVKVPEWNAAWVQATGSVAAICVAVTIAFFERRRTEKITGLQQDKENREWRIKSRSAAFNIYPTMMVVKRDIKNKWTDEDLGVASNIRLHMPMEFTDINYPLYLLEDAGIVIQHLATAISQFNETAVEFRVNVAESINLQTSLNVELLAVHTLFEEALDLIINIRDDE